MAVFEILVFLMILSHQCYGLIEWTHNVVLDRGNMFHLSWKPEKEHIYFKIEVSFMVTISFIIIFFRFR